MQMLKFLFSLAIRKIIYYKHKKAVLVIVLVKF